MSKDGTLRQLERGLALIHSSWVKDLNRQLGVRMVHSQIPAGNFQHVGFTNRLLPPLSSFHALSTRQQPADFRSERLAHPGLVSCSISSQSSHDCASEDSSGRSSPSKRRADSRKGLQSVAGIGPRNEQRLVSKGIESVDRLKDVFYTQKRRDEEKMLTYLQGEIGIRNKRHCTDIVKHLAELETPPNDPEEADRRRRNKVTLCVEGNISAGKSTFLQKLLKTSVELRDIIEVVPEPVDKWQNIQDTNGGQPSNLLEAFYKNPERYAYTFQNYVFVTRLMQAKNSEDCAAPLRLLERSVFSDRMVFVRAVHEAKWLSEMELSIYDSWFDPVVSQLQGLIPDGFIYLAASPETCMRRMSARGRGEEGGVSLDYLSNLHSKHEEWLRQGALRPEEYRMLSDPSRNLTAAQENGYVGNSASSYYTTPPEPESVRGKVFYLNQAQQPMLRRHIDGLPALYLDCDTDIDLERDTDARSAFAVQIRDFSDHVRALRDARTNPGLVLPSEESKQLYMDRCSPEMLQETLRNTGHDLHFPESLNRQLATYS